HPIIVDLTQDPPEGITAGPQDEENLFVWDALIMGPRGTDYENGLFEATLTFPQTYPISPPKMKFTSDMFHPNVYPNGEVCISILHPPGDDPNHYETSAERWSPVQSVEKILLSVVSMFSEPNVESPANIEAAVCTQYDSTSSVVHALTPTHRSIQKLWREDRELYRTMIKRIVKKSLDLEE
ncbi:hypothetical protein SAMD00019534_060920, partial [Acytostelium subglobosum LB1]|uniref:hypothetical protein n=1 Tax=Acytostelium subglobosum LB1 TaxID=1410327 RepID=UPI00064483EC